MSDKGSTLTPQGKQVQLSFFRNFRKNCWQAGLLLILVFIFVPCSCVLWKCRITNVQVQATTCLTKNRNAFGVVLGQVWTGGGWGFFGLF